MADNTTKRDDTPPVTSWPVLINMADIDPAKLPRVVGEPTQRRDQPIVRCPYCHKWHRHWAPANWPRPVLREAHCARGRLYLIVRAADAPALPKRATTAIVGPPPPAATISGGSFQSKTRGRAASASRVPDILKIENMKTENNKLDDAVE